MITKFGHEIKDDGNHPLDQAQLNWTVRKEKLYYPDTTGEHREAGSYGVIRNDTDQLLGIVKDQYTPMQNEDTFSVLNPFLESGAITLDSAGCAKGGKKIWFLAKINMDSAEVTPGDRIDPYLMLFNGHDGYTKVQFGFCPIRILCENMLAAFSSRYSDKIIKVLHSAQVMKKTLDIRSTIDLVGNTFKENLEAYKYLASKQIDSEALTDYVQAVLPNRSNEGISKNQAKVIELFEYGRNSDLPNRDTYWGAYNAVNEFLMHERGRSNEARAENILFARTNQVALEWAMKKAA